MISQFFTRILMVSVPYSHAGLALHQIGNNFEFPGIDVAVSVQVKHLKKSTDDNVEGQAFPCLIFHTLNAISKWRLEVLRTVSKKM